MIRMPIVLAAMLSSGIAQGALMKNFEKSFAKYEKCTNTMSEPKCYKLHCDPAGIQDGQITAYVDVPDPGPGLSRFDLGPFNGIASTHPLYTAFLASDPSIVKMNGRERYELPIGFNVLAPNEPPGGEIVIFELHIHDAMPELGLADIELGFEFDPGDYVRLFDPGPPPTFTRFEHMELEDVPLTLQTADFDGDGVVDGSEFLTWQRGFGTSGNATQEMGDANYDQTIDGDDLAIWADQFGEISDPPLQVVPEPPAIFLAIWTAVGAALYAKRRCDRGCSPTIPLATISG